MRTNSAVKQLPSVLAPVPNAILKERRFEHFQRIRRLFRGGRVTPVELPDGYQFAFAAVLFADVSQFVDDERKSCPFLSFGMKVTPEQPGVVLEVTGPIGTKEFLALELMGS